MHIEPVSSNTPEGPFLRNNKHVANSAQALCGVLALKIKALKTLLGEQYLFESHFGSAATLKRVVDLDMKGKSKALDHSNP